MADLPDRPGALAPPPVAPPGKPLAGGADPLLPRVVASARKRYDRTCRAFSDAYARAADRVRPDPQVVCAVKRH